MKTSTKHYDSVADALAALKVKGYSQNFQVESTCLYCDGLDLRLNPGEFEIDEAYQVAGTPNCNVNAIIYGVSSRAGVKGTFVDEHGIYGENNSGKTLTSPEGDNHCEEDSRL